MAYFPMFINLKNTDCLVVGGGQVAYRKVKVLLDFEARVHVTAPDICREIKELTERENLCIYEREAAADDMKNKRLIVAATDSTEINHVIAGKAKAMNIPVNAVDSIEDCTFIFPSYHREKNVVAAYSSGGDSPLITQYLRDEGRETLTPFIGELSEAMGSLRSYVMEKTDSEHVRKDIYREIFIWSMEHGKLPDKITAERIIRNGD